MNETLPIFSEWSNFYIITGSSSAALTGLTFVVVTLAAERRRNVPSTPEGTSIFSSPTVVHFCSAFFISCIYAAPWHQPSYAGILIGISGLLGAAYIGRTGYRAYRLKEYRADLEDWTWFVILPFVAYLNAAVAGWELTRAPMTVSYAMAVTTLLLIFIGIHNSWDVVNYLARDEAQE